MTFSVLVMLVILALAFDFMNGFHDAANSIATVVSTGVLKPHHAVAWAAIFNVLAILVFHLKVAATVGKGIVDPAVVDHYVIFGALVGALIWNIVTWYFGIPSSSSHALIGGLVGATVAKVGTGSLVGSGLLKTAVFILVSPLLGFLLGAVMMLVVSWLCFRSTPTRTDRWFRRLQLVSSALYSLGHGSNDAQKTIGVIWLLLIAANVVCQGCGNATELGDHFLLPGHRRGHDVRRLAHRQDHGTKNYQAQTGRRLLCGNRWRDQLVSGFRIWHSGVDDAHHHRRHCRGWFRA